MSNPATRPASHWDTTFTEGLSTGDTKIWTLHIGRSFTDVPTSQIFYKKIETIFHAGITTGCSPTLYCPSQNVSRSQMAIFLAKAIAGSAAAIPVSGVVGSTPYNCVAGGISAFTDVLPTDSFCRHVHYIAVQNVTLGCGPGDVLPERPRDAASDGVVRREGDGRARRRSGGPPHLRAGPRDRALLLLRYGQSEHALYGRARDRPILQARALPLGQGRRHRLHRHDYCPDSDVARDEMAKFLGNAFQLVLYGP